MSCKLFYLSCTKVTLYMENPATVEPGQEAIDIPSKIAALKDRLQKIRDGYRDLSNYQEGINTKYNQKIEKATQQRLESLDKWRINELDAAQRLHDSQLYQIENDSVHQAEQAKRRVFQLLLLKHEMISQKLPTAAKYFNKQKCQFIKELIVEELKRDANIGVELPNVPLLPFDEAREFVMQTSNAPAVAKIQDNELQFGDNHFTIGSNAVVKVGSEFSLIGTITNIVASTILFTPHGGNEIPFSLQSINLGLVEFSK